MVISFDIDTADSQDTLDAMATTLDQLRRLRDSLTAKKTRLEQEIRTVQRAIDELEGGPEVDPSPQDTAIASPRSVTDIVLSLVSERGTVTMGEVMNELVRERNTAQPSSVASIVSRMVSNGLIKKGPSRGTYSRIPQVVSGDQIRGVEMT